MIALMFLTMACDSSTGLRVPKDSGPEVLGTVVLQLSAESLDIYDATVGVGRSGTVVATSAGDADLQLYEVKIVDDPGDQFFMQEFDDTVALGPAETLDLTIVATLAAEEPATCRIRVRSDDPNATEVFIPVNAWPLGWDTSDSGGDAGR
jgi:hypothetical protein